MSLSSPFIRRRVANSLLIAGLVLAGIVCYKLLPVEPLSQVEFLAVQVSAGVPGERQFGRIAGVTEMTSSIGPGSTSVALQFELNRDIDAAARDVQAGILLFSTVLHTGNSGAAPLDPLFAAFQLFATVQRPARGPAADQGVRPTSAA